MTVDCYICGWTPDNADERTEEEQQRSVVGHISSSKGDHAGIGIQKARQEVGLLQPGARQQVEEADSNGTDNGDSDGDRVDSSDTGDTGGDSTDSSGSDVPGPEAEAGGESEAVSNGSEAGLGLSGENPFPDSQASAEAGDGPDDDPDGEAMASGGGGTAIAMLAAIAGVGLAVVGAVKNSDGDDRDGPEVV